MFAESWTKSGTGTATVYSFAPSFSGAALAALLGSGDATTSNDILAVTAMAEVKWIEGGLTDRSQTVTTYISNDVLKDTDGTPLSTPTPAAWLLGSTAPLAAVAYAPATAAITFTAGIHPQGQPLVIGGHIYTHWPAYPVGPGDYFPGAPYGPTEIAVALAARINAWSGGGSDPNVTASAAAGVVTLTTRSTLEASSANAVTLTESMDCCVVSASVLSGAIDAIPGTATPPFLRVAGGFLYVQEAGVWKKTALIAL